MSEFLTTKELAELLRIKERKVYDLAASGDIPCSRAMGKLLFPRQAVNAWIAENSSGFSPQALAERPAVFLGSHDPLLDWALRESRCGLATYFDGSLDGLDRFERGEGIATGLHIYAPAREAWNLPAVAKRFETTPAALVEWAWRDRGLIVGSDAADTIKTLCDLRGRRVIPRQPEAGSHALFAHLAGEAGLSDTDFESLPAARSETDAAVAVLEGKAEAAFGLKALATQYRLAFVPLIRERFDLLVDRHAWFEPPFQTFINFCRSVTFRNKLDELDGYDASGFGRVHFNGL